MSADEVGRASAPVQVATRSPASEPPTQRPLGWWGMVLFVTTEATLFALLLGTYFYLRFQYGPRWPPPGIEVPNLVRPLVMTALLVPSSLPVMWAERGARKGQQWRLRLGLAVTLVLGGAFLSQLVLEYAEQLAKFTWTSDVYGSLFYTTTGFHGLHVTVGLLMLGWLLATSLRAGSGSRQHERVRTTAIYWHFVDAVWVAILFTVYLSPHL
jgi:heme/copper-type cytochrome/quinol oxidase subunit 3